MKKLFILLLAALLALILTACIFDDGASSIGIIGGADGPTAIFVTEK